MLTRCKNANKYSAFSWKMRTQTLSNGCNRPLYNSVDSIIESTLVWQLYLGVFDLGLRINPTIAVTRPVFVLLFSVTTLEYSLIVCNKHVCSIAHVTKKYNKMPRYRKDDRVGLGLFCIVLGRVGSRNLDPCTSLSAVHSSVIVARLI